MFLCILRAHLSPLPRSRYPRGGDLIQLPPQFNANTMHLPFCDFLLLILERDPTLIQDMFECEELIVFMCHPDHAKENPATLASLRSCSSIQDTLQALIQYTATTSGLSRLIRVESLYAIDAFALLLQSKVDMQTIVGCVIDALRPRCTELEKAYLDPVDTTLTALADLALLMSFGRLKLVICFSN